MIRWGLLGTAHINRRLIPALRAARRSAVVAVAGRDAGRVQRYAAEWNIPVAHVGYEALLRDASVDAVYIPLPNALHVEWTLRALDAGKHVLCEKPLALSAEDVDRIAVLAAANQRIVAEGFMYRHEPLTSRLLELVGDGAIGPISHIAAGFTFDQSRENDVRLDAALGGGSVWDIGCYCTSVIRLIAQDEPCEVFGWATWTSGGVDEAFTGMLRFAGGTTATFWSSFRATYRMWLEISGRDGTIRTDEPFKPAPRTDLEVRRGADVHTLSVEGSPVHFVREVEDFVGAALEGRSPSVTLADSRGNAATLAALVTAARSGRPVAL